MKTNNAHLFYRRMAIISILVLGFFFIRVTAFCGDTITSNLKETKYPFFYKGNYSIDARLNDWPSKMFYDNIEAMVVYAVANDSSRLYFCIQILDKLEQMNILHEGLTVNIEANGKKKEACSVAFPYGPVKPYNTSHDAGPGDRQGKPGGDKIPPPSGDRPAPGQSHVQGQPHEQGTPVLKQKPRRFSAGLMLSGFREGIDGIYPADSAAKGVETALAYDSTGALVLEAAIPLSCFKEDLQKSKYVLFAFVINSGTGGGGRQSGSGGTHGGGMQGGGMNGGGMNGSGMNGGGMHGGGMHGGGQNGMGHGSGGGPPRDSNTQSQSKNYKIGHKFCIATTP